MPGPFEHTWHHVSTLPQFPGSQANFYCLFPQLILASHFLGWTALHTTPQSPRGKVSQESNTLTSLSTLCIPTDFSKILGDSFLFHLITDHTGEVGVRTTQRPAHRESPGGGWPLFHFLLQFPGEALTHPGHLQVLCEPRGPALKDSFAQAWCDGWLVGQDLERKRVHQCICRACYSSIMQFLRSQVG